MADELTADREADRRLLAMYDHIRSGGVTEKELRSLLRLEAASVGTEFSSYAIGVLRFPHAIFQPLSSMAYSARRKLPAMESSVGLVGTELLSPPWSQEATAYLGLLGWTALHGSQADFGMAILADLHRYYRTALRIAEAFRAAPTEIPGDIIDYYAGGAPDGLCDQTVAFAQEGLDKGDEPGRAFEVGLLMDECVVYYWESVLAPRGDGTKGRTR